MKWATAILVYIDWSSQKLLLRHSHLVDEIGPCRIADVRLRCARSLQTEQRPDNNVARTFLGVPFHPHFRIERINHERKCRVPRTCLVRNIRGQVSLTFTPSNVYNWNDWIRESSIILLNFIEVLLPNERRVSGCCFPTITCRNCFYLLPRQRRCVIQTLARRFKQQYC